MSSVLPSADTEFGARVARRLQETSVAWLTTVDGAGTPQPAPIWFLWDGKSALIYSAGEAKRLVHLRAHSQAALHLDSNGQGGDIVVLTGDVVDSPQEPSVPENPAYLAKYRSSIEAGPWGTPEAFAEVFNAPLRFRPRRIRGH